MRRKAPISAAVTVSALATTAALIVAGCGSTEGTPEAAASSTAASSTESATSTANEPETTVTSSPPPQSNTRTSSSTTPAVPASGPCSTSTPRSSPTQSVPWEPTSTAAAGYRDPRARSRSVIVLTCSGFRSMATASAMRRISHTSCSSTTEHTWAPLPVSRTRTHTSSTATRIRYPSNTDGCWTTMHSAAPKADRT